LIARRRRPLFGVTRSRQIYPAQPAGLQILVLCQVTFTIFAAQANDTGRSSQIMLVRDEPRIADSCRANLKLFTASAVPGGTEIDCPVDSAGAWGVRFEFQLNRALGVGNALWPADGHAFIEERKAPDERLGVAIDGKPVQSPQPAHLKGIG